MGGERSVGKFIDNQINKLLAGIAVFLVVWIFREFTIKVSAFELRITSNERCIAVLQTELKNIQLSLDRIEKKLEKDEK